MPLKFINTADINIVSVNSPLERGGRGANGVFIINGIAIIWRQESGSIKQ